MILINKCDNFHRRHYATLLEARSKFNKATHTCHTHVAFRLPIANAWLNYAGTRVFARRFEFFTTPHESIRYECTENIDALPLQDKPSIPVTILRDERTRELCIPSGAFSYNQTAWNIDGTRWQKTWHFAYRYLFRFLSSISIDW